MAQIALVLTLIVVGALLLVVKSYSPRDAKMKTVLNVVLVSCVVVGLLYDIGILGRGGIIRVPQIW